MNRKPELGEQVNFIDLSGVKRKAAITWVWDDDFVNLATLEVQSKIYSQVNPSSIHSKKPKPYTWQYLT